MKLSLGAWVRMILLGALSGALTGVLAGILARLAMRIVVLNSFQLEVFTLEGTGIILTIGVIVGVIAGALYGALTPILMSAGKWRGLVFGIGVAIISFGPFVVSPPDGEGAIGPEWLGKTIFFALPIVSGVILAVVVDLLKALAPILRVD